MAIVCMKAGWCRSFRLEAVCNWLSETTDYCNAMDSESKALATSRQKTKTGLGTEDTNFYIDLYADFGATSLLPRPKHHISGSGKTQSSDRKPARNPFPFLKLDIISRDDMGKQGLDFIDRKEPSRTDKE